MKTIDIRGVKIGKDAPLALIAGPCAIEGRDACLGIARALAALASEEKIPLVFKASYDKANRSSSESFRGPGLDEGLEILAEVKSECDLPVLTDVHCVHEVPAVSQVADILQLPAMLCRQTDLAVALGETGKPVNVKKGQFLAPGDVRLVAEKITRTGNDKVIVTERGTSFGYNNLVADMRSLPTIRGMGYPVVFDATHSVQLPAAEGDRSGGDAGMVPYLACAAVGTGCDAVFIETHESPRDALSDKDSMLPFRELRELWRRLVKIDACNK